MPPWKSNRVTMEPIGILACTERAGDVLPPARRHSLRSFSQGLPSRRSGGISRNRGEDLPKPLSENRGCRRSFHRVVRSVDRFLWSCPFRCRSPWSRGQGQVPPVPRNFNIDRDIPPDSNSTTQCSMTKNLTNLHILRLKITYALVICNFK